MKAELRLRDEADRGVWSAILDRDETILWAGRPAGQPPRTAADWMSAGVGVTFIAVSTDRRMLIASGGATRSIPVNPSLALEVIDGPPGSLIPFGADKGVNALDCWLPRRPKGFERILNANAVYRMIRDLQTAKREPAP